MQSSSALLIGIDRFIAAASPPSAMIHFALGFNPACSSKTFSETPVYSTQCTMPFHAGISGAFEKIDLVDPRQPLELVQCEDEWLFDKPVQYQPVIRRID